MVKRKSKPSPIRAGEWKRKDKHPLPGKEEGVWSLDPKVIVRMMKDDSSAAGNAAKAVWGNTVVQIDMCYTHASIRWFAKHKGDFREPASKTFMLKNKRHAKMQGGCNLTKMFRDLRRFRSFPFVLLIPQAKEMMVYKWKKQYKEVRIATDWWNAWGDSCLSRIERNCDHPLRGGLASDNNTSERLNRSDKHAFHYIRATNILAFVEKVLKRANHVSRIDLKYCIQMKAQVRSMVFNQSVDTIFSAFQHNEEDTLNGEVAPLAATATRTRPSFIANSLSLSFPYAYQSVDNPGNPGANVPEGSIIMITGKGIQSIAKDMGFNHQSRTSKAQWKLACQGWLETFHSFIEHPKMVVDTYQFDTMMDTVRMFVICSPLNPQKNDDDSGSFNAAKMLHRRLQENGYPIISWDELYELGNKGLMTCNCDLWLHYTFCKHSYCKALERGIIEGYPANRDPRNKKVFDKNVVGGRPKKVKKVKQGRNPCLTLPKYTSEMTEPSKTLDLDKCLLDQMTDDEINSSDDDEPLWDDEAINIAEKSSKTKKRGKRKKKRKKNEDEPIKESNRGSINEGALPVDETLAYCSKHNDVTGKKPPDGKQHLCSHPDCQNTICIWDNCCTPSVHNCINPECELLACAICCNEKLVPSQETHYACSQKCFDECAKRSAN